MGSAGGSVYLFAGDSLTEGSVGESYVERVSEALHGGYAGLRGQIVNAGRSGDTVASLVQRIDRPLRRYQPAWVILAIGSNDIWYRWLSSHSVGWWFVYQYRRFKYQQVAAKDLDQFAAAYRTLIDKVRQVGSNVMVCTVSPLGERLSTPANGEVARLNGIIKHVAADLQVPVADVWQSFVEELAPLPRRSSYVPSEWLFVWAEQRRAGRVTPDEHASRRRLHLTSDGIHLNSRGAEVWAATVLRRIAQATGDQDALMPDLAQYWELPNFSVGPVDVYHSPGWAVRARDLATRLGTVCELLSARTGAAAQIRLAVLNATHWERSKCPTSYPRPTSVWDGEIGTIFAPEAYSTSFLRDLRVPEIVSAWELWPPALRALGEPARATALVDLLVVEQLAALFALELRVAPSDPVLRRLLSSYLTQVVVHAMDDSARSLVRLWNTWSQMLASAGDSDGQVRVQAKALYDEHGEGLLSSFTGQWQQTIDEDSVSQRAELH